MEPGDGLAGKESNGEVAEDLPDVCVVTHPLAAAGENATRSLLDILAAITNVALVTADLPADSEIREKREVVELTERGAGNSIVIAAWRFFLNQLRMCRVIRRRHEPVVLFFGATSYVFPILFARIVGKTVLVEPRGDVPLTLRLNWERRVWPPIAQLLAEIVRLLEHLGFRFSDAVITYTPSMAEQLGLAPNDEFIFPTGARYVRTEEFFIKTPYDQRNSLVGFLGRLDEEKGIRELADAIQCLPDDISLRFVGDGDLRPWLERELVEDIESGRVEITGWVDHSRVPDHLNDMKLLVMPSQPTEGLPTSILEALACGTPVYATPVSGVPDVIRDGETGFIMKSKDPDRLTEDIRHILDRGDLSDISEQCRHEAAEKYSFEAATARYRRILTSVI